MFGSLALGDTEITNFLPGADCLSTIRCFRQMGVSVDIDSEDPGHVIVHGNGLHGLKPPAEVLDCGNSGTTTRLLSGILAGQDFACVINGDESIQKRPMRRIITPLTKMGGDIQSVRENDCAPLLINGTKLQGIHYNSPVASAQVKSCVLLAGLFASSATSVTEPAISRNHTELMLRNFGADISREGFSTRILPDPVLTGCRVDVPGDISSAAYFIAAAAIIPDSSVRLHKVGTNPTRDGILRVLEAMGGKVNYHHMGNSGGESYADLQIRYAPLHGTTIEGSLIPTLIDELPVIAVMAATAEGDTVIRDAQELKVKESNRLDIMVESLRAMGADVEATDDGMIIHGGKKLHGAVIDSHKDHRIAMSFAIAAQVAEGETEILDADCVNISYPEFYRDLHTLLA
jgi:3-phosphoshikimate 1-carboxyvinyltransferase